jgi:hypothetical protein
MEFLLSHSHPLQLNSRSIAPPPTAAGAMFAPRRARAALLALAAALAAALARGAAARETLRVAAIDATQPPWNWAGEPERG